MGFDIKKIIGSTAPWLATALGGPLAGQAVASIAQAMGLKADAKLDDIGKALAAGQLTGDQLVAMKAADLEFQKAVALAGFADVEKLAELAASDRDSARKREMTVKDKMPTILGLSAVGTLLVCIGLLSFRNLPPTGKDAILILLGAVVASYKDVYGYFFGSSAGSDRKTEILANGNGQPH